MGTESVTGTTFEATTGRDGVVLVEWWADWCGPSRAFSPVYAQVAAAHPEVTFGRVDTVAQPRLAAEHGIGALPVLMVFRDGILVYEEESALLAAAELAELVRAAQEVDVAELRRRTGC